MSTEMHIQEELMTWCSVLYIVCVVICYKVLYQINLVSKILKPQCNSVKIYNIAVLTMNIVSEQYIDAGNKFSTDL